MREYHYLNIRDYHKKTDEDLKDLVEKYNALREDLEAKEAYIEELERQFFQQDNKYD